MNQESYEEAIEKAINTAKGMDVLREVAAAAYRSGRSSVWEEFEVQRRAIEKMLEIKEDACGAV